MSLSPRLVALSKWVSWALRHDPRGAGIILDKSGWTSVDCLIRAAGAAGRSLSAADLAEIVATNEKRRFSFSSDGQLIRANQGHSVQVDLGLVARKPPSILFHGTATRFVTAILQEGLKRGNRHHVHLSGDRETAVLVGRRRGPPALFTVDAARLHGEGFEFYCSENGVWLSTSIPAPYLSLLKD